MDPKGRVALVTGGAVRIGRAISVALAAAGADVIIHYRNSKKDADKLRRILKTFDVRSWVLQADLSSEAACVDLIRRSIKTAGRLDMLVNNAAVFHKDSLRKTTEKKLLEEFWPNLFAPMILMRAFAEHAKAGKIINLVDRRITSLDTEAVPYVLTKKALAELTRIAALEFAPSIAVNAVAPGAILPPPGKGMDYLEDKAGPIPLKRRCLPEEVADTVVFMMKNDAMTGQVVFVDGGQHLLGMVEA